MIGRHRLRVTTWIGGYFPAIALFLGTSILVLGWLLTGGSLGWTSDGGTEEDCVGLAGGASWYQECRSPEGER